MKFNLTKFPIGEDDKQLKDENGKNVTFKEVLIKAITSAVDGRGQQVQGEEKFKRFDMYMRLKKSKGIVELNAEDVVMLTNAAQAFPVIVAGECRDFLAKPESEEGLPDNVSKLG
jgi:hypothetical protein